MEFVSYDDCYDLGVEELNPEYLLMQEEDIDLIDIMQVSDSDSGATESESAVSTFLKAFN